VSAAAEGEPTEAPSLTATATETTSPSPHRDLSSPTPTEFPTPVDDGLPADAPRPLKYVLGGLPTDDAGDPLTGDDITDAFPSIEVSGWVVQLELDADGAQAFANITSELACERDQGGPGQLAIVLDDVVESAPTMNPGVACGSGITGGPPPSPSAARSRRPATSPSSSTGALPITLNPPPSRPCRRRSAPNRCATACIAGVIGLILVGIYLVFFYRVSALVALGAWRSSAS
jgi:preprotein translocase subunit SecD